ncbi:hypothetical protein FI667_g13673, partial [Globisporangium splendens]
MGEVAALVTHLRTRLQAPLARIHAHHRGFLDAPAEATDDEIDSRSLEPTLRSRKNPSSSSSLSMSASSAAVWRRILLLIFRRYAGDLVVKGKLLNQEELLVSQFCRVGATGRTEDMDLVAVVIPASLSLRFIVCCEDAPSDRIGQEDLTARVLNTPQKYETSSSSSGVTATCRVDESPAFQWPECRPLQELDSLYGFDLRYLKTALSVANDTSIGSRLVDENEDSANTKIARALAFHDLRYTQVMLRSYLMVPRNTTSAAAAEFQSFAADMLGEDSESVPRMITEEDPRSYISLGKAQKQCWANERFVHGEELVAKGRLKDALAEFSSCLKLEEEHAAGLFARGKVLAALQQYADAIRDFDAVRKLNPQYPDLDAELSRAKGKLRHSRHVDIPSSSMLPLKRRSYSKDRVSARGNDLANVDISISRPDRDDGTHRMCSSSVSVSVSKTNLEKDRLRKLLEDEEYQKKRDRERRRKREASRDSDSDRYSSSSSDDEEDNSKKKRREKSARKSNTSSKKSRRDKDKKSSKKKKKAKKNHHRRKRSSSLSPSSSDYSSDSGSDRSRRKRRRDAKAARGIAEDDGHAIDEAPHPILARQRHRIWN